MSTKIDLIQDKSFNIIQTAVNKLGDAVRPTLGPSGNKMIIDKQLWRMVIDDGVQIARDLELQDPAENAVIKIIREVAVKTNDRVGDGTTTSLLILQAIINEAARLSRRDGRKITAELKRGAAEFKEKILKSAKHISTKEDLRKVSMIAFDDEKIAGIISDLYFQLGKDGVITIDKSSTMETYAEAIEGFKIDRGYVSPYMINQLSKMETIIERPYILITDYRLMEAADLLPIMNLMAGQNKRELVVICDNMENHAMATAVANIVQRSFFTVAVTIPKVDDKTVLLEDMGMLTGAKVFSQAKGDKLDECKIEDLGRAERFICRKDESVIVGPGGKKEDVKNSTDQLKTAILLSKDEKERMRLEKRLGQMTNKITVIKVGAPTENEQKSLKYKVEDAVNAVKSAYKGGVVCGSGLALLRTKTSSPLLNLALSYPYKQICENMGVDEDENMKSGITDPRYATKAVNLVTGDTGNFLEVGVVDPVEVLIAGVESAVSIASILLTSYGFIVESQKEDKK